MPRPPRFEYPGAIYHVLSRGNYRSWIFEDDGAKSSFQKCLMEACERAGWALHAYCVMGNHYHLAIETPEPNLSDGMRWLQSVFANRFNRFRKERGHLFQGRFKSILVENWDRLAWLCHYIHLNPVRAGICDLPSLKSYRYSSYWHLRKTKAREPFMRFQAFLEGAGGLKDTPGGRRKYEQYLAWLSEDDQARKNAAFDRMSKGWALGSKEFKKAVLKDEESRIASIELGSKDYGELREELWEDETGRCMELLGKKPPLVGSDPKSADWKVAIAARLKKQMLCTNSWIGRRLNMGAPESISRYCSELSNGNRPLAKKLLNMLYQ